MSWRPANWNRKLPGVGRLVGDIKILNLADAVIARKAFEAGADAILEALEAHTYSGEVRGQSRLK